MNFLLAFSAAIAVAVANFSLMNQNEKSFEGQVIPISTQSDHFLGPLISHFDIYTIAALPLHRLASKCKFYFGHHECQSAKFNQFEPFTKPSLSACPKSESESDSEFESESESPSVWVELCL